MAKAKTTEDRVLEKLGRIEELLENLLALQGTVAAAHKTQLAKLIGIDKNRVTKVSAALKAGRKAKTREGG